MLLSTCATELNEKCDIQSMFSGLMERLADFASKAEEGVEEITKDKNIFDMFKQNIDNIISDADKDFDAKKLVNLQIAFMKFTQHCYP